MPSWQVYIRHSPRKTEPANLCVHGDQAKAREMAAFIFDIPPEMIHLEAA